MGVQGSRLGYDVLAILRAYDASFVTQSGCRVVAPSKYLITLSAWVSCVDNPTRITWRLFQPRPRSLVWRLFYLEAHIIWHLSQPKTQITWHMSQPETQITWHMSQPSDVCIIIFRSSETCLKQLVIFVSVQKTAVRKIMETREKRIKERKEETGASKGVCSHYSYYINSQHPGVKAVDDIWNSESKVPGLILILSKNSVFRNTLMGFESQN